MVVPKIQTGSVSQHWSPTATLLVSTSAFFSEKRCAIVLSKRSEMRQLTLVKEPAARTASDTFKRGISYKRRIPRVLSNASRSSVG